MTKKTDEVELQSKIDCYSDMLFKIAYLRLQNVQDAEDVVQEVFYRYIRREEDFESGEHEKAWLIKVTLNACRKVWRSAWNRHRDGSDPGDGAPETGALEAGVRKNMAEESAGGLEEKLLAVEKSRQILSAVRELPSKYRDVIHLFYYEELSVREIGEVTGRRESTVTSQLTRGRELLKRKLKEEYDFA